MNYKDMMNAIGKNGDSGFAAGMGNTEVVSPLSISNQKPIYQPTPSQTKYTQPQKTPTIPEDLEGQELIRIIDAANKKDRPLYAMQNASGTWTLEDGSVISQAALEYLRSIGVIAGGGSSLPTLPPVGRFPGIPGPQKPGTPLPKPPRFRFPGAPPFEGIRLL